MENFKVLNKGRFVVRNKLSNVELTRSYDIDSAKRILSEFELGDRLDNIFDDKLYEIYDDELGITID